MGGSTVMEAERAARLAALRVRVSRLEGTGSVAGETVPLGVEAVDAHLPGGGLARCSVHQMGGRSPGRPCGAQTAFAAVALARVVAAGGGRPVLWVVHGRDLYAPGLAAFGLTPDRLIAARAHRPVDVVWAMEEALRGGGLAAVLGEVDRVDPTVGRRLQLAAETGGVTGFLLLKASDMTIPGVMTRWLIAASPGEGRGAPGLSPSWDVELIRCRGGQPGRWIIEWDDGQLRSVSRSDQWMPSVAVA